MITVSDIIQKMQLEALNSGDLTREVTGGYCGDLLSHVMGRAQQGDVWITIIGNVNVAAVAVLADTACILLAENSPLDEDALARAESNHVTVLRSEKTAYELASELSRILE